MRVTHGGDLYTAQAVFPGEILDFSVNVHPLGTPTEVLQAAERAIALSGRYPDPGCHALREAIGAMDRVPPDWILCGNGASELIFRLAQGLRPGRILLTEPTFLEYRAAFAAVGSEISTFPLREEDGFDLGEGVLQAIDPEVELVLLCNPNNPTGRRIPEGLLQRLLRRCNALGVTLVVDECFLPLTTDGVGLSAYLAEHPGLVLLRAFTKSYAIPGLRLGYCLCSDTTLLERLEECGPAWSVSLVAQEAGIACCRLPEWAEAGRVLLAQERPLLEDGLERLGLTVVPSHTNYILFRRAGDTTLKERLLALGILIRSCGNYPGLGEDWYRIAVRRREENDRLLQAIGTVL